MVIWGAFTNSWGKKRSEKQGRKGNIYLYECKNIKNIYREIYTHMNPRISRWDKKVFNEQWKEVEVNNGKK